MKHKLLKIIGIVVGLFVIPGIIWAVQVTVPSGNGSGFLLQSLSSGNYGTVSLTAGSGVSISTTTTGITITAVGSGGAGSGTVSTTTPLVSGQVDFSTSPSTIGNDSTFLFDTTLKKLTFTTASSTTFGVTGYAYIPYLGNLTTNGFVKTNGGTGQLTVDTTSYVSGVTGTWPIKSSGGTTPVISFGWATTSQPSSSNLVVSNGSSGFYGVATSSETCTSGSGISCTAFNIVGTGGAISLSAIPNSSLSNSTISGISLGSNLASLSTNSSLSGTSYNGSAAVSDWGLNLANPNTWTALQTFAQASTTNIGSTGSAYFATSNGAVGIGTTLPNVGGYTGSTLTISGSNPNNIEFIRNTSSGASSIGNFTFGDTSNSTLARFGANSGSSASKGNLIFSTSAGSSVIEAMRIDESQQVGIGTTSPGTLLSVGNTSGINFTTATTTYNTTGGLDLRGGGCYAIAGVCISGSGGGSGTVTSVTASTPNSTLSLGGTNPVTTSGTISFDLNLNNANNWAGLQQFKNASSTLFSAGSSWFGSTATTTINGTGAIAMGTSTPWASMFAMNALGGTAPLFDIGSSTADLFNISASTVGFGSYTIGSTSPFALFTGVRPSGTTPLVALATSSTAGSQAAVFELDAYGRPIYGGPRPTCDANCTMSAGNDARFRIITGSTITSTTVTFVHSWGTAPVCFADEGSAGTVVADASSTPTTVVITLASALTSKDIEVHCDGINNQ